MRAWRPCAAPRRSARARGRRSAPAPSGRAWSPRRADCRRRSSRRQRDEALDEFVVDLRVDVDALDAAAALAGIEERAVDEVLDRDGRAWRRAAHRPGPCRRARARASRRCRPRRARWRRPPSTEPVKLTWSILPEPISFSVCGVARARGSGTARRAARPSRTACGEALADQQRLRGVLEDHRVARHQRRHDGVDGGEVGIVPRRDDHDDAERLACSRSGGSRSFRLGAARARAPSRRSRSCAGAFLDAAASRRHSAPAGPSARRAPARSAADATEPSTGQHAFV